MTTIRIMADGTPGYTGESRSRYEEIWKHLPIYFLEVEGYGRNAQIPAGWWSPPGGNRRGGEDFYDEWDDLIFFYTNDLGSMADISTIPTTDLVVSGHPLSDEEIQVCIETYGKTCERLDELKAAYQEGERILGRPLYKVALERIVRAMAGQRGSLTESLRIEQSKGGKEIEKLKITQIRELQQFVMNLGARLIAEHGNPHVNELFGPPPSSDSPWAYTWGKAAGWIEWHRLQFPNKSQRLSDLPSTPIIPAYARRYANPSSDHFPNFQQGIERTRISLGLATQHDFGRE